MIRFMKNNTLHMTRNNRFDSSAIKLAGSFRTILTFSSDSILSNLFRSLILCLLFLLMGIVSVSGVTKTWSGTSDSNWNTPANWNPSGVPGTSDDVTIPDGKNVTVNTAAVCASFTISGGSNSNTITISSGQSIAVSGAVSIGAGNGNGDNKIIAVGSGAFSCSSIIMTATGNSNRNSGLTLSSGSITVTGDVTMSTNDYINFTGAGSLIVGGNMTGGTITPSTGTVNYNGAAQTVGDYTYYNLIFSGSDIKT